MHYWLKSYRCELLAVLAVARTHAISLGLRVRGWIACPAGTPELQSCLSEGHGFTGCGKNSVSGRPGIPRRSEHCPRRKCSPIMGPETGENGFSRPSGTRNLSLNTTQDCVLGYFQVAPSGLDLLQTIQAQLDGCGIPHSGIKLWRDGLTEYFWLDDPDGMRVEFWLLPQ